MQGVIGISFDDSTYENIYKVTKAYQKQQFRLDFDNGIPRKIAYVRVDLKVDNNVLTPLLHFSSTDDNCQDGRQQFAKEVNSDTVTLWLKVEEFEDGDLFIVVDCLTEDFKTDYTLTFTATTEIQMNANFVYSYLVGSGNKDMNFVANLSDTSEVVTFYAVGSKSVTINVDEVSNSEKFNMGSAITVKKESISSGQYAIRVTANEGDYVTVGVNNVNSAKTESDLLKPNGLEVSGFLVKSVLEDQCFEMGLDLYKGKTLYINGRFYNRIGEVYLRDTNFNEVSNSDELVTDGFYTKVISASDAKYLCVRFPEEQYTNLINIPFTFYITEPTANKDKYKYLTPQVYGQIYRRSIPKGDTQFFSSLAAPSGKRITFNVKAKTGFPIMYVGKCRNYPQCDLTTLVDAVKPKKVNRMFSYSVTELPNEHAIGGDKYVILVTCNDDDNKNSGYCVVETSFVSTQDVIEVIENETFGQFVKKSEKNSLKVNIDGDSNVRIVNIDIMVLSGDVSFSIKGNGKSELNYHKYYLSNKVYFKIPIQDNEDVTEFTVDYTASLNSYYTFKWNANRKNDGSTQYRDYIVSGSSYLVDIDPTSVYKTKTVKLQNLRYKDGKPFLANFFSLNCEFKVTREKNEIKFFDGYAQEVVTKSSEKYENDYYDYVVSITDPDLSNYNYKMCMLYVAGMETSPSEDIETEIVVGENINQQIIFEDGFETVRFLYPNPDITKDLVLKVNVIDTAIYRVSVIAETTTIRSFEISRTKIIYLPSFNFEEACDDNNVCPITIQVQLVKDLLGTNSMVEITLRPILNTPTYLQKGQAKNDFVCGEKLYYLYTDIGKNEEGEVLINFLRSTGKVFAKVVRKDETSPEQEANWRDMYRMPSEDWEDSLEYNAYTKKLLVRSQDTYDCIEGCYLLISIQLNVEDELIDDYRFFLFSILTRITPANRAYTDIPKVVIQANEYIIGNVDVAENERIYEFYEIWLPHDSERVEFDWQSEVAGIYVNLGGIRPTTRNADFKLLPSGSDSVLELSKNDIIDKAKAKGITLPYANKIQDLNLVIGVWTDKTNSVGTELYSLRVHQPTSDGIDIVEVNTNQKILCKPNLITTDQYRCLFMVVYEEFEIIKNLIVHAASNDLSATNYIYARYIEREIYDQYKTDELKSNIPTPQNADFDTKTDDIQFLFTESVDTNKYLYISVVTNKPSDIKFLSNFGTFTTVISPNPSSETLLTVDSEENIALVFQANNDIVVNMVGLYGEAEIYWNGNNDELHLLKGNGDKLTLTSGKDFEEGKSLNMVIVNKNSGSEDMKMENPGCAMYVFYHLRNPENNFDEIFEGKSLQVAYKNTDLPIYLFNKVHEIDNDINVFVHFDEIINDANSIQTPFKLYAALVKENIAYLAKSNPDLKPAYEKSKFGVYDPAVQTAQVFLSTNDLKNFNIKSSDNPTLYYGLVKNENNNLIYDNFNIETQVFKANEGVPQSEGVYIYGKVITETGKNYFKLKTDKTKKIMRIQISFNSDSLDYIIGDSESSTSNMTFSEAKRGNGKSIITLTSPTNQEYIYLIIKIKDAELSKNQKLNNYCFKYNNAESASEFKEYKIKSDNRNVKFTEKKSSNDANTTSITATFNKIDAVNASITYYFKAVPNSTHTYKESYDTIAVSESPCVYTSVTNPSTDTIELVINEAPSLWVFLEVTAVIFDGENVEYETYKGEYKLREYVAPGGSSGGVSTTLFVVVGGILLAIVIALVIVVIWFIKSNQSLVNQVKHISFQNNNNNSNVDSGLLLKKNQDQQQSQTPATKSEEA